MREVRGGRLARTDGAGLLEAPPAAGGRGGRGAKPGVPYRAGGARLSAPHRRRSRQPEPYPRRRRSRAPAAALVLALPRPAIPFPCPAGPPEERPAFTDLKRTGPPGDVRNDAGRFRGRPGARPRRRARRRRTHPIARTPPDDAPRGWDAGEYGGGGEGVKRAGAVEDGSGMREGHGSRRRTIHDHRRGRSVPSAIGRRLSRPERAARDLGIGAAEPPRRNPYRAEGRGWFAFANHDGVGEGGGRRRAHLSAEGDCEGR